jgi:simple sugar transport system ATP-binding protein
MTAGAPAVELVGLSKRFGDLQALADVSLSLPPGDFHAILGENGAGKSTLVKCVMGYHRADAGRVLVDGRPRTIAGPRAAAALGFGMVYQHFTLVPSMTVAENLVLGMPDLPAVVRWADVRARIDEFQRHMPFRLEPDRLASTLAAGEKQRLEIMKQLFLGCRVLILDEPTSVLTPEEADQILGVLGDMTAERRLTVALITHKLREVEAFAREVTVLRGGRRVAGGRVGELSRADLVRAMVGGVGLADAASDADRRVAVAPDPVSGPAALELEGLTVLNDREVVAVDGVALSVRAGEIVGVAGVSGNGQRELVEAVAGQRAAERGVIRVGGARYTPSRTALRERRVHVLPEEPLASACVRGMSVAENLSFRRYDEGRFTTARFFLRRGALRAEARELIGRFRIRCQGPDARLETLSGGNVQRTVLARELSADAAVLVVQNPCAGLDIAATAETRARVVAARNSGAAVLLVSEDLDELLELSDRIVVMFEGRLVYETARETADLAAIGHHMASV